MNDTNTIELTEKQIKALNHLKKLGHSNSRLASALDVSTTTASNLKQAKRLPKSDSDIWQKLYRFLNTVVQPKREMPLSHHMKLPVTDMICRELRWAHKQNDIALIYGAAGVGKSHAAKHYYKENGNVTYLSASPATDSVYSFLCLLSRHLNCEEGGSKSKVEAGIIKKINSMHMENLIIIDEAHHLPQKVIDQIRCLYDSSSNIGVALIGNMPILQEIKRRAASAQIISRIGRQIRIDEAGAENVIAIIKEAAGDILDKELVSAAKKIALGEGALRRLIKILRDAIVIGKTTSSILTSELLMQAAAERVAESHNLT